MNLSKETVEYIQKIVDTAQLVGIDEVVVEADSIRAVDENRTVVICHGDGLPNFEFGAIGLSRLSTFKSRLAIAEGQDGFKVEAETRDDDSVMSLKFKGKGTKIDYLCGRPSNIKAPRAVNEQFLTKFTLNETAVKMISKGQNAMGGADTVTFICDDNGEVKFEIVDTINKDVFEFVLDTVADGIDGEKDIAFVHRYPIKTLLAICKDESIDRMLYVGKKGILKAVVNNITVFVIPKV